MAWTLQDCIQVLKQEYPERYPYVFVEHNGRYVFNLILNGESPDGAISDMHIVDPKNETVSGGISVMELMKDPSLREKWKHANLVSNHDESLHHSIFQSAPTINGRGISHGATGYRVRRHANEQLVNTTDEQDCLCHHGIKGQSWGVRNGPPYPLDQKTHNKVVQKSTAKKVSSVENQNDGKTGLIPELIAFVTVPLIMNKINDHLRIKNIQNIQKQYNKRNQELSKDLISDIADTDKQFSDANPPKQITGKHSIEDDMAACNPKYKNGVIPGTSANCTLCAFTYDLRRRGYDVTALSSDTGNHPDTLASQLHENPKIEKMRAGSFTQLYENAAKHYPEGARGEISVNGAFMGHSMAWEVHNGKLEVIDSQRNVKVSPQELSELGFASNHPLTHFIRTDNLKIKNSGINLVAAELKSDWKKTIKKGSHKVTEKKAAGIRQPMTRAERIQSLEEQWKKDNPNSDNTKAMKNWVEAQMKNV